MGWKTVYRNEHAHRAVIVRDVLIDRGIEAVLVDLSDSAYRFGHFEVRVAAEGVLLAIKIINEEINFE